MSQSDQYVLEMSTGDSAQQALFKQKRIVYAVDSNSSGGAFGQEIQFDLSSIGSQSDWVNLAEAQIVIPVMTTVTTDAVVAATSSCTFDPKFSVLKNGSHHFVHSAALNINGRQIQDFQSFQNVSTHADIVTQWSQEELSKWSSTLHMSKSLEDFPSIETATVSNVMTANGFAMNNVSVNPSFLERTNVQCSQNAQVLSTIGYNQGSGKSIVQVKSGILTAGAGQYLYAKADTIVIRLKDIVPAVESMPMVRNLRGTLYLKVNSISASLTVGTGANGLITAISVSSLGGSSSPVSIQSNLQTLNAGVFSTGGTLTLRCGPSGQAISSMPDAAPAHVNARLVVAKYEATPEIDAMLTQKKTFTVLERRNNQVSLAPGQGNTFNISAGIANPRIVRCYPFYTGQGTSGSSIPATYNPWLSLISSEGATTSPLAQLTNFNVYVANRPTFQDNSTYDYENFTYEVTKQGFNGGQSSELTSGLLNSYAWERFYRHYVADVSRHVASEDGVMKSIQVQATNSTKMQMSILVDIFSEREYTIDTALCVIE